jgi:hypothetical protein
VPTRRASGRDCETAREGRSRRALSASPAEPASQPAGVRTPAARAALAAAALAVVVALFVVLSGGDDGGTEPAASQPRTVEGETGSRSRQPRQQAPAIERIVIRGGRPVGGVKRLQYESGERVRFSVRSDVADEIHVHGFDIAKDVPAGGNVRFGFPADIEGVFEIELEHRKVEIARLRVKP